SLRLNCLATAALPAQSQQPAQEEGAGGHSAQPQQEQALPWGALVATLSPRPTTHRALPPSPLPPAPRTSDGGKGPGAVAAGDGRTGPATGRQWLMALPDPTSAPPARRAEKRGLPANRCAGAASPTTRGRCGPEGQRASGHDAG